MICSNCEKDNPDTNKFCLQCGQALTGGAAVPPAGQPGGRSAAPRSLGRLPRIIGGVLLLVALAVGAYFLLPKLLRSDDYSGREMLLAAPNRRNKVDLSVLRLGDDPKKKAVTIAEGITATGADGISFVYLMSMKDESAVQLIGGTYGGFLPGTNRLVSFFRDNEKTRMLEYVIGAEEPVEIIDASNAQFQSFILPDSRNLFIQEALGADGWRCHVAASGKSATRLVRRADYCGVTGNGAGILAQQVNSKGKIKLTTTDLKGGNEIVLLDGVEGVSFRASSDASHIAYLRSTDNGQSIFLSDNAGNELLKSPDFVEISDYGFVGTSDTLYYIGATEDGVRELYTSVGNKPLIESPALRVIPASDGSTLAVLTGDEDGEGQVSVINLATGEAVKVFSGDFLRMAKADTASPRLLVKEEFNDELVLTATEMSGANPVMLFDDDGFTLSSVKFSPDDNRLFLTLVDEDSLISLFVVPLDGSPGHFVVEEWTDVQLRNLSGDTLLLVGREDMRDDLILFAVKLEPGAKSIELDDNAENFGYAVVAPDGRTVLYNAIVGMNPNNVVVRQIRLDGEGSPEDLYDEMLLVAVRWDEIDPFNWRNTLSWLDTGPVAIAQTMLGDATLITSGSHRGAITRNSALTLLGESFYGELLAFHGLAGQSVRIDVLGSSSITVSNLDPGAILMDAELNDLAYDDDSGNGYDAQIYYSSLPKDGFYYLLVTSYDPSRYGEGDEMTYEVILSLD